MIALVLLGLILLLLAATPWRSLPVAGRLWAVAALLNTALFLAMPTTPATSPFRPVVERLVAASAAASLALVVLGLILRQRQVAPAERGNAWAAPLILGALPVVVYVFFWVIGPLY